MADNIGWDVMVLQVDRPRARAIWEVGPQATPLDALASALHAAVSESATRRDPVLLARLELLLDEGLQGEKP